MTLEIDTCIELAKEPSHIDDVVSEEIIQRNHVSLFAEEDVVREVLDDLRDDHETTTNDTAVVLRYLHIDDIRRDHSR